MIEFFHEFTPPKATAQSRRHNHSGATYMPTATKRAAALLQAVFEKYAPDVPSDGPICVAIAWTFPGTNEYAVMTKRPDLDNLAKLALDAATRAGYWKDDAQICKLAMAKFTGPTPGLSFKMTNGKE